MVFLLAGVAVAGELAIFVVIPAAAGANLLHATRSSECALRLGIWLTALRVIVAYPLFGVGLGPNAYRTRAEPCQVPPQTTPQAHPHSAFLEIATMDGIPTLASYIRQVAPVKAASASQREGT